MIETAVLKKIRRHPIKSVGGESLSEITLIAGAPLPGDRIWAILHEAADKHLSDGELRKWLPKSAFLRGAAAHPLQAITGGWHDGKLSLMHPERPELRFDPDDGDDMHRLLDWVRPLWPADKPVPSRLVRGPQALTDNAPPYVSILSLDSLSALEDAAGQSFDTHRWRGNLWVEGWPARYEAGLIGKDIAIGTARLRIAEPIGRCTATDTSARTGKADCDMLSVLKSAFGDTSFGVFALVETGGTIRPGDRVEVMP